jgi:hypothetical protein
MSENCTHLRDLNLQTFTAEAKAEDIGGKPWRTFLEGVLSDDFLLRRSDASKPNEGKEAMLDRIEAGPIRTRHPLHNEIRAWCTDTLGVVAGPVEMDIDGVRHRYQNVKVFRREPGGNWECVYWQVTETPMP